MEKNYDLLAAVHIFDANVMLDTLTRLINEMEGKRYYLRQYDIYVDENRATERKIYRKLIQWRDKDGKLFVRYDLGEYRYYQGYDSFYDGSFHEQILFSWSVENSIDNKDTYQQFQFNESVLRHSKKVKTILNSPCKFDDHPYIEEFIQFLINYRIEHQLVEITEEQIDEALTLYMIKQKEKEKKKVLLPNKLD